MMSSSLNSGIPPGLQPIVISSITGKFKVEVIVELVELNTVEIIVYRSRLDGISLVWILTSDSPGISHSKKEVDIATGTVHVRKTTSPTQGVPVSLRVRPFNTEGRYTPKKFK